MQSDPAVSVCIVTYRRPAPLSRLLESLARQAGILPSFEVVIVDNDAEESALPVCREFEHRLPIRYAVEPRPGIATARNRTVETSRGNYLVFLDDDHEVGPDWLAALFAAAVASGADGVFAPVIGRVEGELPAWVRDVRFFDDPPVAPGASIPWYRTRTGNCCVRREALPSGAPFDVTLALIGGEDVDLFARMIRRGARLIAVGAPVIHEIRPAARANAGWLLRRSFRNGGTFAHVEWRGFGGLGRARRAVHALRECASCLWRALLHVRQSRSAAFAFILRAASALGEAAWVVGIVYAEYGRKQ